MTPEQFQTLALAWLATVGTVAGVAIPLYFKIKADIETNKARIDKHDEIAKVDTTPPQQPPVPLSAQSPIVGGITRGGLDPIPGDLTK